MGHEIVYCSGCQTRLRGPDAYHDAKGSWCAACAPPPQPLPAATPRSGSTLPRKKTARSVAPSRGAPAVLLRCEAAAAELRGTPLEPRLRAVEAEAGRRKSAELEKKVDDSLAQAREILASPTFRDREAELRAMLQAARGASDARRADVDRLLADLDRALAPPRTASRSSASPSSTSRPESPSPASTPSPTAPPSTSRPSAAGSSTSAPRPADPRG
jgi:hypothetical protein